jgi:hypothetical protein
MESLMTPFAPEQIAQNLHDSNERLVLCLDKMGFPCERGESQQDAVSPRQMQELMSELMRAGEWLRSLPTEKSGELQRELSAYQKNVERLRDLLPWIHSGLLRERAQLERERTRVQSATEWARRSRMTL